MIGKGPTTFNSYRIFVDQQGINCINKNVAYVFVEQQQQQQQHQQQTANIQSYPNVRWILFLFQIYQHHTPSSVSWVWLDVEGNISDSPGWHIPSSKGFITWPSFQKKNIHALEMGAFFFHDSMLVVTSQGWQRPSLCLNGSRRRIFFHRCRVDGSQIMNGGTWGAIYMAKCSYKWLTGNITKPTYRGL